MITIDVKTALIYLVYIALIIFLIFLSVLIKNLIKTIKETNKILDDAAVVSGITADKATEIDGMVDNVHDAVSGVTEAFKGNQSMLESISTIVKTVGSIVSMVKKGENQK